MEASFSGQANTTSVENKMSLVPSAVPNLANTRKTRHDNATGILCQTELG